jgi:hypothetical protein
VQVIEYPERLDGVAGGDFDLVRFAAESDNVVGEDNFSLCHKMLLVVEGGNPVSRKFSEWNVIAFRRNIAFAVDHQAQRITLALCCRPERTEVQRFLVRFRAIRALRYLLLTVGITPAVGGEVTAHGVARSGLGGRFRRRDADIAADQGAGGRAQRW